MQKASHNTYLGTTADALDNTTDVETPVGYFLGAP